MQRKSFPEGVNDLESFAQWATDQLPTIANISDEDEEAVYLAREMVSALPISLAEGDMADEVQKAYDSFAKFKTVLVTGIENKIAALPDPANVSTSDADEINSIWEAYADFNSDLKPLISSDSVDRLKQVYSGLSEALFDWHMQNNTPFVALTTDRDGIKYAFFGQNFEEAKFPGSFNTTKCTSIIGRGNFDAADFFSAAGDICIIPALQLWTALRLMVEQYRVQAITYLLAFSILRCRVLQRLNPRD